MTVCDSVDARWYCLQGFAVDVLWPLSNWMGCTLTLGNNYVSHDKNRQSLDFVTSMSKKHSSNCVRRVVVSYNGEVSLHFEPPTLYSCRERSPLLRALIRIRAPGLSRYSWIRRTTERWLTFLASKKNRLSSSLAWSFRSFRTALPRLIYL